jgi:hypothetical protein
MNIPLYLSRKYQTMTEYFNHLLDRCKTDNVYVDKLSIWQPNYRFHNKNKDDYELFYKTAKQVMDERRTLLDYDRLYNIWQAIHYVLLKVEDYKRLKRRVAVAEVGVYRGGSSYFIANTFKLLAGYEMPMVAFDTFVGHPNSITKRDKNHIVGGFGDVDYDDVKDYLSPFRKLEVIKGEFPQSTKDIAETEYAFVHIDTDIYLSTMSSLSYFGNKLVKNGVIVLDDFDVQSCPGVRKAIEEYLKINPSFQIGSLRTEQMVLFKS